MAKSEEMPITPAVIAWAREWAGYSLDDARVQLKFAKIEEWESGASRPTYPQLENLAGAFKVPVAVFFFPEPPHLSPISKSFRTLGSRLFEKIPSRIRLLIRKAQAYQLSLEELYEGKNPSRQMITRNLHFDSTAPISETAHAVRKHLGISLEQQREWPDNDGCDTALKQWRKAFWDAGIHVFKDQFRQPDFSGFCLYHEEFPVIYINNTTTKTRQIFTLFHELGHLLYETSGIFKEDDSHIDEMNGDNRQIETMCNHLAARTLVPEDEFDRAFSGGKPDKRHVGELANLFKVSREVIYRRFLDRNFISVADYKSLTEEWRKEMKPRSAGGNPYHSKIVYLGSEFINRAFSRYYQNKLSQEELADILDVKPGNLDAFERHAFR